jgi:hypothetical protein
VAKGTVTKPNQAGVRRFFLLAPRAPSAAGGAGRGARRSAVCPSLPSAATCAFSRHGLPIRGAAIIGGHFVAETCFLWAVAGPARRLVHDVVPAQRWPMHQRCTMPQNAMSCHHLCTSPWPAPTVRWLTFGVGSRANADGSFARFWFTRSQAGLCDDVFYLPQKPYAVVGDIRDQLTCVHTPRAPWHVCMALRVPKLWQCSGC